MTGFAKQNDQAPNNELAPIMPAAGAAKSMTAEIRRANNEELARAAGKGDSKKANWGDAKLRNPEFAAMEALERLFRFLESLESKSGKARQLRDFAKSHEGTRAGNDAKILAENAE